MTLSDSFQRIYDFIARYHFFFNHVTHVKCQDDFLKCTGVDVHTPKQLGTFDLSTVSQHEVQCALFEAVELAFGDVELRPAICADSYSHVTS